MVRKSLDLLGIMLIVAIEFILVGAGITNSPVNVVFGVLLALVLPGYALSAAVFRKHHVQSAERAALTLGISLSVAILGGLLLDALPGGLQTQSWLFLLGGVTVGAAVVALLRRLTTTTTAEHDLENQESQSVTLSLSQTLRVWLSLGALAYIIRGAPRRQILMIALAVVVFLGGIVIAVNGAQQEQTAVAVTQLWLLPDKTAQSTVQLGIHTEAAQPMEYRLALSINGVAYRVWSSIPLSSTDTWEMRVTLPSPAPGSDVQIEAALYREDQPNTIFRHVSIVLSSSGVPQPSPSPTPTKGT